MPERRRRPPKVSVELIDGLWRITLLTRFIRRTFWAHTPGEALARCLALRSEHRPEFEFDGGSAFLAREMREAGRR